MKSIGFEVREARPPNPATSLCHSGQGFTCLSLSFFVYEMDLPVLSLPDGCVSPQERLVVALLILTDGRVGGGIVSAILWLWSASNTPGCPGKSLLLRLVLKPCWALGDPCYHFLYNWLSLLSFSVIIVFSSLIIVFPVTALPVNLCA